LARPEELRRRRLNPNRPEVDQARLQEIYSRTAAFYDEVVAVHQARVKEIAIELLARQPDEWLLEAGVGTAWAFGRVVAATGGRRAIGLDVASGMLDVSRDAIGELAPGERPELMLGDGMRLPFRDGALDCALCTYTLDVLPAESITPVLVELRRVLRAGGRLVVAGLTDGEGDDASFSEDWRTRYTADPEYFGGARPLQASPHLLEAGFAVVQRHYSGGDAGWPSEIVLASRVQAGVSTSNGPA
jgi:ubiquinone/menaquinone biosynthesis C-methylase UbiE